MNDFWCGKKILVTGGAGFLGSHIITNLTKKRLLRRSQITITKSQLCDLRVWSNCLKVVENVDLVIHLAARVGGIGYNKNFPGTLFYDNIMMGAQLIEASRLKGVKKFVQVGTVCAYPKFTPAPFKEENLWNGYPEETNAPYGIAKKALLVMSQAYREQYGMNVIYLLPANLYGPRDNFNPVSSHVIPSLIRKFIEAIDNNKKEVTVWGKGEASREFLYAEDAAEGIIAAAEKYNKADPVNLGTGNETTIKQLVDLIAQLTKFKGQIVWDASKLEGQPRRCLDTTRARNEFGFEAKTDLASGLKNTISWYKRRLASKN